MAEKTDELKQLQLAGARIRGAFAKQHPMPAKHLAVVRETVADEWRKEQEQIKTETPGRKKERSKPAQQAKSSDQKSQNKGQSH